VGHVTGWSSRSLAMVGPDVGVGVTGRRMVGK
jgi:hypothetical protein